MIFSKAIGIGVILCLLFVPALVSAHGPRGHKVRLVQFNRPLPAPDFSLSDPQGNPIRLSDFRGKFVLLNFWATWCPPCVREMPSMERLTNKMKGRPFSVLAVSLDVEGAVKVKPFIARLGVTFPIALDPQSKAAEVYGARDLPSTFLIDPKGRVIGAAKGERDWASDQMVEYIEEVLAGQS